MSKGLTFNKDSVKVYLADSSKTKIADLTKDTDIESIVLGEQWDDSFYCNLVEKIEIFNDRSLNIHLNLMPYTCCAKVLKGKEIIYQNAQKMRAKSAFCTYRGSSVPGEYPLHVHFCLDSFRELKRPGITDYESLHSEG